MELSGWRRGSCLPFENRLARRVGNPPQVGNLPHGVTMEIRDLLALVRIQYICAFRRCFFVY